MSVLLLTGYDDVMAPIGAITHPRMQAFADVLGIGFRCFHSTTKGQPAYWEKVPETLRAFDSGWDSVLWMDADQLITNEDVVPPGLGSKLGFHASLDWGLDASEPSSFSMCAFVIHKQAAPLFTWLEENKAGWINKPFPEQAPMRHLMKANVFPHIPFTIHPRRMFNAVPDKVCPGKVPDPWRPGDWSAHLTMIPVNQRVELAKEIISTL